MKFTQKHLDALSNWLEEARYEIEQAPSIFDAEQIKNRKKDLKLLQEIYDNLEVR